jgi:hypothetical protein
VPSAVITRERVDLVHDHGPDGREEITVVGAPGYQHDLQGLRRGQQQVRRLFENSAPITRSDIAVPNRHSPTEQPPILAKA